MFIIDILAITLKLFLEMTPYILLGLLFVGILNLYFSRDLIIRHIGSDKISSVFKAALFGIPLPLCSCGVVPSAVFIAKNGASRGSVVSFLTSTPQTGIDSIIATYGMMGPIFAIFRPFAALAMGITGGLFARFIKPEKAIAIEPQTNNNTIIEKPKLSFSQTIKKIFTFSFIEFLDDISIRFVIGLFIAGLITFFIPEGFFEDSSLNSGILGMLMMVLIGVPMYICATASIPIAVSLILKGFSPGVAFVFLAAGPAVNAASLPILVKVLGKKITSVYVLSIIITSIACGYLLDYIFYISDINPTTMISSIYHQHHSSEFSYYFEIILGILFFIFILLSFYRKLSFKFYQRKNKMQEKSQLTINVEGMECNHCAQTVKNAISAIQGVKDVSIDLKQETATIYGNFELNSIKEAIKKAGYKA